MNDIFRDLSNQNRPRNVILIMSGRLRIGGIILRRWGISDLLSVRCLDRHLGRFWMLKSQKISFVRTFSHFSSNRQTIICLQNRISIGPQVGTFTPCSGQNASPIVCSGAFGPVAVVYWPRNVIPVILECLRHFRENPRYYPSWPGQI